MKLRRRVAAAAALTAVMSTAGLVAPVHAASVGGGGATFLANMMDICAAQYNRNTAFNTGSDTVTYASVGSGSGRSGFANGTYKFGGSESAYPSNPPANLVYVPLVGGPIGIGYRIDGMTPATATVRLTGELVAKIFAGQITNWNDPAIAAVNKATTTAKKLKLTKLGVTATVKKVASNVQISVTMTAAAAKKYRNAKVTVSSTTLGSDTVAVLSQKYTKRISKTVAYAANSTFSVTVGRNAIGTLAVEEVKDGETIVFPDLAIKPVYRSGNSGTTNNFANYLNKSFPAVWTKATNDSFTTAFPGSSVPATFQAASGNEGVSNLVRDTNGAVTYAEISFLEERKVSAASVLNPGGRYVTPSSSTSSLWLEGADVTTDGLVNQNYAYAAPDSYPINAVSYGLGSSAASTDMANVKRFFSYFINQCAPKAAAGAGYAPLTGAILAKAQAQLAKLNGGA